MKWLTKRKLRAGLAVAATIAAALAATGVLPLRVAEALAVLVSE